MGSACACPADHSPMTPRPYHQGKLISHSRSYEVKKFASIIPAQKENIDDSLFMIKNQLSCRIKEYEAKNGLVTDRISAKYLQDIPGNQYRMNDESSIAKVQKIKLNGEQKNDEKQSPIRIQNIGSKIEESEDSVYDECAQQDRGGSCVLSQLSHILGDSIFTERQLQIDQFYRQHRYLGDIQLLEWNRMYEQPFAINPHQLESLGKQHTNIKMVLQSIVDHHVAHYHHLISVSSNPPGINLHINGRKRLFPLSNQLKLQSIVSALHPYFGNCRPSDLMYYLTGWFPEQLKMAEITSFSGIFDRLASNLQDGNSVVYFSRKTKNNYENVLLTEINLQTGIVEVNHCGSKLSIPDVLIGSKDLQGRISIKIQYFVELFDSIYLNWNPIIYDVAIKRECKLSASKVCQSYSLIVPPSTHDIQIRMFLQTHHTFRQNKKHCDLVVKLYQSDNEDQSDDSIIRIFQIDHSIFSDVFVFQSCKEKSHYTLTVEPKIPQSEDIFCNVRLLSFVDLYFESRKEVPLLREEALQTTISSINKGYGINSPYFNNNLQFLIEAEQGKILKVQVDGPQDLVFEICLIPNQEGHTQMIDLQLQSIINNSCISKQKKTSGAFSIKSCEAKYLLVINSFSSLEGTLKVEVSTRGKQSKQGTVLSLRQLIVKHQPIFSHRFKWLPTHFGPRKRFKSNCNGLFQNAANFQQYFNNPIIDKTLEKGMYQFFVRSQSFRQRFDSLETFQQKNFSEPPALSMSLFLISTDKTEFKIILDDAFYVPFGVGYWTGKVYLEEGNYRFVVSKMDKIYALGNFGILKLEN